MKLFKTFVLFVAVVVSTVCSAQESADVVTDEELKKYAIVMDSINTMTKDLMDEISELVKSNDQITAARYNELSKIITDETKLAEAKATPVEIEAVKEVLQKKDEGTARIQGAFQSLAKDYIGAATYNKVKKALAQDANLKEKYDGILAELNKDDSE